MRKMLALLLVTPLFTYLPVTDDDTSVKILFNRSFWGPFEPAQENESFTFTYTSQVDLKNVYEMIEMGPSYGTTYNYSAKKATHSIFKEKSYSISFTLPLKDCFTDLGCYFHIYIGTSVVALVDEVLHVGTKDGQTADITDGKVTSLQAFDNVIYLGPTGFWMVSEKYTFDSVYSYFMTDTYYRLPLDQFHFGFSSPYDFCCSDCYMEYNDRDSLFPSLRDPDTGIARIPLKTVQEDDVVRLEYRDIMYVEPVTLQMSLTEKEGFVATRYFYMPRNHRADFLDTSFTITLENAGADGNTIVMKPRFLAEGNLIGDCSDSDYCVKGGVR